MRYNRYISVALLKSWMSACRMAARSNELDPGIAALLQQLSEVLEEIYARRAEFNK